jgi:hypothetical protein
MAATARTKVFHFCGRKNVFIQDIYPPMDCHRGAKICVLSFSTFYSVKNITDENNCVKIGDKIVELTPGNYNLTQVCEFLSEHEQGKIVNCVPLYALNKVRIDTKEILDFDIERSLCNLLGFDRKKYSPNQSHVGEHDPQLNHVQTLSINCLNAEGSFQNGIQSSEIHSAHVLVPPTFRIISEPKNLIYYKIKDTHLTRLIFEVRDETGQLISPLWGSDIRFSVILAPQ